MKIISAEQTRQLDQYTIQHEPIASIDLMERASLVFVEWFTVHFPAEQQSTVLIFCGPGNNGGDGLAIARLLSQRFYTVEGYLCQIGHQRSEDYQNNLSRLPARSGIALSDLVAGAPFPPVKEDVILIDAIFGSGLNRPVEGYWSDLFDYLNQLPNYLVSVDIPSGLFADQHSAGNSIQADYTFSFELPKLAFLFPENAEAVGDWHFASIGLHPDFLAQLATSNYFLDKKMVASLLKPRKKYAHKGTFGHALLMAGSYGKVGAAVLAAKATLRAGAGLLSIHAPTCAYSILQTSIPEAMVNVDADAHYITSLPPLASYRAIGIGCGIDKQTQTAKVLKSLLETATVPLVLDADALNILSEHPAWFSIIPKGSILTPHPKEFERLFGKMANDFTRNALQRKMAKTLGVYILLKGAHTCIASPNGICYFNSTGNPGMGTGGSGDVLTGLLIGLLAQGYDTEEAAILGVYLHGLSGDLAVADLGNEAALIAGDLVNFLGKAYAFISP